MTLPICVLVSGRGTNLQAILDAIAKGELEARIALVISNRPDVPALERAQRAGAPTLVMEERSYAERATAHAAMADALRNAGARLIVLAGFDRVLADAFFERLAGIPVINVHPALLPRFGGRGMLGTKVHAAVLASGDKVSGVTVHRAGPGTVDEGEILVQRRVPVLPGDTPDTLAARVLAEEHKALVDAVARFVPAPAS